MTGGRKFVMHVPKGSVVILDIWAAHMNRTSPPASPHTPAVAYTSRTDGQRCNGAPTPIYSSRSGSSTPRRTAGRATHASALPLLRPRPLFPVPCKRMLTPAVVLAFSAGARGCIGQRFAIAESVCVLARLVRRYEILLPEGPRGATGRGREEALREALAWTTGVTITPTNARVRLRRLDV